MEVVRTQKQKILKFKKEFSAVCCSLCEGKEPRQIMGSTVETRHDHLFPNLSSTNIVALIRPFTVCAFLVMTTLQTIKCPPWMYVGSGVELHTLVALGTRWRWLVSFVPQPNGGGWEGVDEPVGTVCRRGKPLALFGNRTTISRSPSL
jgi:hypothetical protein